MTNPNAMKKQIDEFWASISAKDIERYLACFAPSATAHDPVINPPLVTSAERRKYMEGLFESLDIIAASIDFITVCGTSTAAKWTVKATSAGNDVLLEGIDTYRHGDDGRIEEMWGYFES
tara:strand:+ start:502 stop:861 length:360 start_codon:yes stop_codon:yes gene_type:complete